MDEEFDVDPWILRGLVSRRTRLFAWHERHAHDVFFEWTPRDTENDDVPLAWLSDEDRRDAERLFRALAQLAPRWNAYYLQQPDDAWTEMRWTRELAAADMRPTLLHEFMTNPADQAGKTFLGLYGETLGDQVLFAHEPGRCVRVSLFGRMRTDVPSVVTRTTVLQHDGKTFVELDAPSAPPTPPTRIERDERARSVKRRIAAAGGVLRRWNPIGVDVPPDEYDSYALQLVALVDRGASEADVARELAHIASVTIGVETYPDREAQFAAELIAAVRGAQT